MDKLKNSNLKWLVPSLVFAVILSLFPIFKTYVATKGLWHGVPIEYVSDTLYYEARMKQVEDGYFFIGNPYIKEYRKEDAPAFFVSDWLASIPLLLNASFNTTLILNLIIWNCILVFLIYKLFEELGVKKINNFLATIVTYLNIYWLMVRPVVMQTVFPGYVFFLYALLMWFRDPNKRVNKILLILSSIYTFYIYTYLYVITIITFGLLGFYFLCTKEWKSVKNLIKVFLLTAIFSLPSLIYTKIQISNPFYAETLKRIGLIKTHLPTASMFIEGKWVLFCFAIYLSLLFIEKLRKSELFKKEFVLVFITGLALLIASSNNIITGKELETAAHVGRFMSIWAGVFFFSGLFHVVKNKEEFFKLKIIPKLLILVCLAVPCIGIYRNITMRSLDTTNTSIEEIVSNQEYGLPAEWLNKNAPKESVVWTNGKIGDYLPIITTDYLLFHPAAVLQLMPDTELEERYLVNGYFRNLTLTDIENDYRTYAGVGNAVHGYLTSNRRVVLCNIFNLYRYGFPCGKIEDAVSYKGEEYFKNLYAEYKNKIVPDINNELKKYNVKYLLFERSIALKRPITSLKNLKKVYSDNRFDLYEVVN